MSAGTACALARGAALDWGRHYLMCAPEHFRLDYAINPWMDLTARIDPDRALEQWHALVGTLRAAGATVETIPGLPQAPDMVFAMNYGLVDGDRVAITSFRHPQRRPESAAARDWFQGRGLAATVIGAGSAIGAGSLAFEAGDAFLFGESLLVAAGPRTDAAAHAELARVLGVRVRPVPIAHPALYHLDLSFCPLDSTHAIVAPGAWSAAGRASMATVVPEPLVLSDEEAFTFAANSVVVDRTVIMPASTPVRVARQLEAWGFTVALVDVSEAHKAGGSVRCMTLPLDTRLDAARVRPAQSTLDRPAQSTLDRNA